MRSRNDASSSSIATANSATTTTTTTTTDTATTTTTSTTTSTTTATTSTTTTATAAHRHVVACEETTRITTVLVGQVPLYLHTPQPTQPTQFPWSNYCNKTPTPTAPIIVFGSLEVPVIPPPPPSSSSNLFFAIPESNATAAAADVKNVHDKDVLMPSKEYEEFNHLLRVHQEPQSTTNQQESTEDYTNGTPSSSSSSSSSPSIPTPTPTPTTTDTLLPQLVNQQPSVPTPPASVPPAPTSSWAALFSSSKSITRSSDYDISNNNIHTPSIATSTSAAADASTSSAPWSSVSSHSPSSSSVSPSSNTLESDSSSALESFRESYTPKLILPRGLVNNGNMCFMNSVLQSLLHCPPFYNCFKDVLAAKRVVVFSIKDHHLKGLSLVEAVILFLQEFHEQDRNCTLAETRELILKNIPFAPDYIYDTLQFHTKTKSIKGKQEDAEEFLGFLLDGLHEELLAIQKAANNRRKMNPTNTTSPILSPSSSTSVVSDQSISGGGGGGGGGGGSSEWTEVGTKNKAINLRQMEVSESPINRIFGGKMRSIVKCSGSKNSATLEPFTTIQLTISKSTTSIEDALDQINAPETIEGFTSSKGIQTVATKQMFIEHLPPVLILHLKRFVYDDIAGCTQKIHRHISYPEILKIKPELLSSGPRSPQSKMAYRLFAVIYHHGHHAAGGHYTVDVQRGNSTWLSIDDTCVEEVPLNEVLSGGRSADYKQAYMLFYIRS